MGFLTEPIRPEFPPTTSQAPLNTNPAEIPQPTITEPLRGVNKTTDPLSVPEMGKSMGIGAAKGTGSLLDWFVMPTLKRLGQGEEDGPRDWGEYPAHDAVANALPKAKYPVAEKMGEGAIYGAPFGVAGAVSGAASSGMQEALDTYHPGHPIMNTGAALITGLATAPILSKIGEFGAKAARSIPEQFGMFKSPVNDLFSDIGNPRRAAGMNDSWPMFTQGQNALRQGVGGSGRIIAAEQEVFSAIENRANQIAARLGPDLTQQELGSVISQNAGQRVDQIKTEIGNMYNALNSWMPNTTVVFPSNFANALFQLRDKYAGAPRLREIFEATDTGRYLNALGTDLINSPSGGLPYKVLQNMRTDIGEMIGKGAINPNINVKELRGLYRSLTSDMESAFNSPGALRAFRTTNRAAESMFDDMERLTPWARADIEPEQLTQRLLAMGKKGGTRIEDVTSQLNNVDPGTRDMVMGYVLRDMGRTPDKSFNPTRFWTQWQQLSPEAKDLFPTGQRAGIERLAQLTGLTADSFATANTSHTSGNIEVLQRIGKAVHGLTLMAAGGGGSVGGSMAGKLMADDAATGAMAGLAMGVGAAQTVSALVSESLAQNMLARLWTSRKFNTFLGTQAPNLSSDKAMRALGTLAGEEPELAGAIQYIVNYMGGTPLQSGEKGRGFAEGGYNTQLNPQEESLFEQWKKQYAPNDSGADYDLRGAFKAGLTPAQNGHWNDEFKKPNHPTFSNESKYSRENPELPAGRWDGENFIPPNKYAMGGPANDNDPNYGNVVSFGKQPRGGYAGGTRNPEPPSSIGVQKDKSVLDLYVEDVAKLIPPSAGNQKSGYVASPTKHGVQWETNSPMDSWDPPIDVNDAANDWKFGKGGYASPYNTANDNNSLLDRFFGGVSQGLPTTSPMGSPNKGINPLSPALQGANQNSKIRGYAEGGSAIDPWIAKTIQIESGGKNIKSKTSSASGVGQMIDKTWRGLMAKYRPDIANPMAVKNDEKLQIEMLGHLKREGTAYLQKNGVDPSDTNVYLTHFLGPAGAVKVLKSSPDTPMASLFNEKVLVANEHLRKMRVGDLLNMVNKKMGEPVTYTPGNGEYSDTTNLRAQSNSIINSFLNTEEEQEENPNEGLKQGLIASTDDPATKVAIESIIGRSDHV